MASENTAIHDLLAGLQRKPLDQDPDDDVLFAGSRREDAGPRRAPRGTQPPPNLFEMPPAVLGPLPPAQLAVSLPHYGQYPAAVGHQPTSRVSRTAVTRTNKKLYFIPAGLAIVAAVLVAILMGGKDEKPTTIAASAAAATDDKPAAELALEAAKEVAAPPSVTPITDPAAAAPAGTTVTPLEPAAAPAVAPEAPTGLPKDAVAPAEVVPASAFVAAQGSTVETVPTVPVAAAEPVAAEEPVAAAPKTAHKAKKSRGELAREKRAAKRATKRSTKRETKQVARAEPAEKQGSLNGNGALAVSSSQPREVWVDGRNSKRMTPLRVLLKPGKHKVTLFDKEHGTAKTFEVEIKPDTTTKVAK